MRASVVARSLRHFCSHEHGACKCRSLLRTHLPRRATVCTCSAFQYTRAGQIPCVALEDGGFDAWALYAKPMG